VLIIVCQHLCCQQPAELQSLRLRLFLARCCQRLAAALRHALVAGSVMLMSGHKGPLYTACNKQQRYNLTRNGV
jgi:hypothetical protein